MILPPSGKSSGHSYRELTQCSWKGVGTRIWLDFNVVPIIFNATTVELKFADLIPSPHACMAVEASFEAVDGLGDLVQEGR